MASKYVTKLGIDSTTTMSRRIVIQIGRITTVNTGDNSDFRTDDVHEAVDEANGITLAPVTEIETQPIWARRTVLKAAALGTAAAALVSRGSGGLRLAPLPAAADDLSGL